MEVAERRRLEKKLEKNSWTLWGYVRQNQHSLDSELHTSMIQKYFREAIEDVERRVEEIDQERLKARKDYRLERSLRVKKAQEIEKLKVENRKLAKEVKALQWRLDQ